MNVSRTIRTTVITLLATLTVAPFALAGGEAKNSPPFTKVVTSHVAQTSQIRGEQKNGLPFTRPTDVSASATIAGEAKNLEPFTRTLVAQSGAGSHWIRWSLLALLAACALGSAALAARFKLERASRTPKASPAL
jgi:hypothetical protein